MDIYLDMDGVIANWNARFLDYFGINLCDYNLEHYEQIWDVAKNNRGYSKSYLWKQMDDIEFWRDIEPYFWTKPLIDVLVQYDKNYRILTTMSPNRPFAIQGKFQWLEKHFPAVVEQERFAFTYGGKHWFGHHKAVLIDDHDLFVNNFRKRGYAILFPQFWNRNRAIRKANHVPFMLDYIIKELDIYKEATES